MKINWIEGEQILLLNMIVQVVEFCNIWLTIIGSVAHITASVHKAVNYVVCDCTVKS